MERIIEAYGLGKVSPTKGAPPILDNCSISIGSGMTAVVGPSGAGKTSLLYALSGLDVPDTGQVLAFGQDVYALPDGQRTRFLRERVGFVFQDYNLVPYLTVKENALLPLSLAGHRGDPAQLAALLNRFGLSGHHAARAQELSGGERQRCALIRALMLSPKVLFADEPTGALDTGSSHVVLATLKEMASAGCAVVVVTHDPNVASATDAIIFMRDGRITHVAGSMAPKEILDGMKEHESEADHA